MAPYSKKKRFQTVDQQLDAVFDEFLTLSLPGDNVHDYLSYQSDLVPDTPRSSMVGALRPKGLPSAFAAANARKVEADIEIDESLNIGAVAAEQEEIEEGASAVLPVSEEQIQETASAIAQVGDELDKEYGPRISNIRRDLLPYFNGAVPQVRYEIFAGVLNELIGQDRSVDTFVLVMQVSKDIMQRASGARGIAHGMFKQFLRDAFSSVIEEKGSIAEYTKTLQKK